MPSKLAQCAAPTKVLKRSRDTHTTEGLYHLDISTPCRAALLGALLAHDSSVQRFKSIDLL